MPEEVTGKFSFRSRGRAKSINLNRSIGRSATLRTEVLVFEEAAERISRQTEAQVGFAGALEWGA